MTSPRTPPSLSLLREAFPALQGPTVFLENAGGSQVPAVVSDRIREYMRSTYVQLGADYELSKTCTSIVDAAHELARTQACGAECGHVALSGSCSTLLRLLADAYGDVLVEGDEVVVAEAGHESNIGPWRRLERRGVKVRTWPVDPETGASRLEDLAALLGERTRVVAFAHVSNLLGEVLDVKRITEMVHAVGAQVVVDGVAYAPHRAMDVASWGVDWYAWSTYKVYGPHMGALFGRHEAFAALPHPNHFFVAHDALPYAFELGGASHEGCAGLTALGDYLAFVAGHDGFDRRTVEAASARWEALEAPLTERLLAWVGDRDDLRLVGSATPGPTRVPTVSFVHAQRSSREIALAANAHGMGIRHGHMYAYHLCEAMGIDPEDGVVRISAVHYNTPDEVERLIEVLDAAL